LTEAIRYIPLDRILIESDDYDGDCCEIYQQIAHIKGISADELDNRILLNGRNVFRKSMKNWLERTELLLGKERLDVLQRSHVLVAGLGG
jgi:hypothetical protein